MIERCTSLVPPAMAVDGENRNRQPSNDAPSSPSSSMPVAPCTALASEARWRKWSEKASFTTEVSGPGSRPWLIAVRAR